MQDIAGCRVVVGACAEQDAVAAYIRQRLEGPGPPQDLRQSPSNYYRAVHVIVHLDGKTIEVQIRTTWQHNWANLSEKLADIYGLPVKYGDGPPPIQSLLKELSEKGAEAEGLELELETMSADDPGRAELDGRLNTIRMDLEREISATLLLLERERVRQ